MKTRTYLTFDIGTTALKTALVADDGRMLGVHVCEYTFDSPQPDWAEQHPDTYWQAAVDGVRSVIKQSDVDPSSVAAIGFSSQAQTFVSIDANGMPLHDAIVWVDKRAKDIVDAWESEWLSREDFKRISGYSWMPYELAIFKIAWLMRNVADARRTWKFLFLPDYLIYRMTGAAATDRITATMAGMLDLGSGKWNVRLLDAAGISEQQLPQVLDPGSVAGVLRHEVASVLGLKTGVPVCVGANDQIAGAIGAGNVQPGVATETTGTSLAVVATTEKLLSDSRVCIGRHAVDGSYYAMQSANTSAIVLKWFRDICSCGECYDDLLKDVERIPYGSDGLIVLPHFSGSTSNPDARGAFVGLTLGHTRVHIVRAIMESCCCLLRECLGMVHEKEIARVRSLGGAARSDVWLQMKADMLKIEVERPVCTDAASLGAAMMAAAGIGRFTSIAEASDIWYRTSAVFRPNPASFNDYDEVYKRYRSLSGLIL